MTKIGASQYALTPGGPGAQTIISAGANVNGAILRTIAWHGAGNVLTVAVGGTAFLYGAGAPDNPFWVGELYLPAGTALTWNATAAGQTMLASYDLL